MKPRQKKPTPILKKAKVIPYQLSNEYVYTGIHGVPQAVVPEIKVTYTRGKQFLGRILDSRDVAVFLKAIYGEGKLQLQEAFYVLYLNKRNEIIGYYKHTVGSIDGTMADIRIIYAIALTSLSVSIVLCHNHPSGNIYPSEVDKQITKRFNEAGKLMEIKILDHIILTQDDYYSFADNSLIY